MLSNTRIDAANSKVFNEFETVSGRRLDGRIFIQAISLLLGFDGSADDLSVDPFSR